MTAEQKPGKGGREEHGPLGVARSDSPLEETAVLVYRVIKGDRARREDFLSDEASGKRPRDLTPEKLRRHKGFSIWRVEAKARRIAQRFQRLGTHIAEVRLPAGATLEPFPDEPDHQTIYGDPDAFVERVERVVPV